MWAESWTWAEVFSCDSPCLLPDADWTTEPGNLSNTVSLLTCAQIQAEPYGVSNDYLHGLGQRKMEVALSHGVGHEERH